MLTSEIGKRQELRIEMQDEENNKAYALYDKFVVEGESREFQLSSVGQYSGDAGR